MAKIFRVNMTDLKVSVEEVPENWDDLGGRALTSRIVSDEVPPNCHPLGANNKLVFAPGILTGTAAANSGRLSAGAKSPLTGGIKESNVGGTAGQMLARMGIKALIIEGQAEADQFYGLQLTREGVEISAVSGLVGQGNFAVIESLMQQSGAKVGVISIGQAGEMKMASANISVKDPQGKVRSHGRGGLGAVMGAKGVKYISIDETGAPGVELAEPERFKVAARTFAKILLEYPTTGKMLPQYGTAGSLNVMNAVGALPTNNFRVGQYQEHEKVSGETLHDTIVERGGKVKHGCHAGCVIQCSQVYTDKQQKFVTSGFEYETIWGLGVHSQVTDLDLIARADYLMDDIGIDSIELTVAIGIAMEAGVIPFGDADGVVRLLNEVAEGTPLGRVLGGGAALVGRTYGVTRVPVVKGQSMPAYDPRVLKGIGITYATSPMGADHTAGYAVLANATGKVPGTEKAGQVELSRQLQILTVLLDSAGLCLFTVAPADDVAEMLPTMLELCSARTGVVYDYDKLTELGVTTLKTERAFNLAAGLTNADDRLPEFFSEPFAPHNAVWDFTGEEIDEFWNF